MEVITVDVYFNRYEKVHRQIVMMGYASFAVPFRQTQNKDRV